MRRHEIGAGPQVGYVGRGPCRARGYVRQTLAMIVLSALCACFDAPAGGPTPPPDELGERPTGGLFDTHGLQAVAGMAVAGDVRGLIDALGDDSAAVRARAAYGLPTAVGRATAGTWGDRLLLAEESGAISAPEISGTQALAPELQDELVDALERSLTDSDAEVRAGSAFALGRIEWPNFGPEYAASLTDRAARYITVALETEAEPTVRVRLLRALGELVSRDSEIALAALTEAATSGSGPYAPSERPIIAASLARVAVARGPVPIWVRDWLTDALTDADPGVRRAAASFFTAPPSLRSWGGRSLFLRLALDEYGREDPAAGYLATALARMNDPMDASRLREWADSATDWRTRAAAVVGLDPLTISGPEVVAALEDPMPGVARAAAEVLAAAPVPDNLASSVDGWLEGRYDRLGAVRTLMINRARTFQTDAIMEWVGSLPEDDPAAKAVATEVLTYVADSSAALALERLRQSAGPRLTDGDGPKATGESAWPVDEIAWAILSELGRRPVLILETSSGTLTVELFLGEAPMAVQALVHMAREGLLDGRWLEGDETGFALRLREDDWNGDRGVPSVGSDPLFSVLPVEQTVAHPGRGALVLTVGTPFVHPNAPVTESSPGMERPRSGPDLMFLRNGVTHVPWMVTVVGRVTGATLSVLDELGYLDRVMSARVEGVGGNSS